MTDHVRVDATTVREWLRAGRSVWFVHAGSAEGFRRAHLPGAIRFDDPAQATAVLRHEDRVVVYGEVPGSSLAGSMVRTLRAAGFVSTYHLDDGLDGWRAAGGWLEGAAG